jgi:hypothetical protein
MIHLAVLAERRKVKLHSQFFVGLHLLLHVLCMLKLEKEGKRCLKENGYVLPLKSEILMDLAL